MDEVKISVIIPAFNSVKYIARSINSVVNQSFRPYEIIVVDDGSSDNLSEFISANFPEVIYIFQQNSGPSSARNNGLKSSTGNFLAFLDADDYWTTDHLKNAYNSIIANPELKWYVSGYKNLNTQKKDKVNCVYKGSLLKNGVILNYFKAYIEVPGVVWTGAVVVSKELMLVVNGFNENFRYGEDLTLWFQLALIEPNFGYSKEITSVYNKNETSLTNAKRNYDYTNSFNVIKYNYSTAKSKHENGQFKVILLWIDGLIRNVVLHNQRELLFRIRSEFREILTLKHHLVIFLCRLIPF